MSLAELLIPEIEREMARTRKVLEKVPEDRLSWKAAEGLHDIAWNANHLVDLVSWAEFIVKYDEFDIQPPDGPPMKPLDLSKVSELLATFDGNVKSAIEAISTASDETLAQPWSLKAGGHTLFTLSKGECLRTWVLNHAVHHRAILSIYLRMAGISVTPPYDG